jgi:hypothetical protein
MYMALYAIDALLLMLFGLPVVLRYKILPTETTPYWLFGIVFFILIFHLVISLYPKYIGSLSRLLRIKSFFLWTTICIVLFGVVGTSIIDRSRVSPTYGVHDIILQQEAAMRYLIQGKNPYKETYFGTPVEQFHYDEVSKNDVNPALYHFVMPPWYLLFPFSFYFISIPTLGYFDGRFALLFTMILLLIFLSKWFKNRLLGNIAIVITALSPATVDYFIEGRSDMFALSWFVVSLVLLERKRISLSALFFAFSLLSKQTIWFALPFYLVYLWNIQKKNIKSLIKPLSIITIVCLLLVGPFLLWDYRAFIESVILYLSGGTSTSYPVSGYGLSMMLYEFGFISDRHAYYPFIIWQILFGLPVLIASIMWLIKSPRMGRLLVGYAVTLSVVWYTSRYFNNSHMAFLSSIFALGVLKDADEQGA